MYSYYDVMHIYNAAVEREDPNAPKPVGPSMQPAVGVPLESRPDWHRSLEAAIQHHSSTLAKSPAISMVDPHGKVSVVATYSENWGKGGDVGEAAGRQEMRPSGAPMTSLSGSLKV